MTPKRAKVIIQRYYELCENARSFLDQLQREQIERKVWRDDDHLAYPYGIPNPQLDQDGGVLFERNTSCHCHPEMRTFKQPPEKFFQWLENNR